MFAIIDKKFKPFNQSILFKGVNENSKSTQIHIIKRKRWGGGTISEY
jgi:hypothetical protein